MNEEDRINMLNYAAIIMMNREAELTYDLECVGNQFMTALLTNDFSNINIMKKND